jgi:hypothetical protein
LKTEVKWAIIISCCFKELMEQLKRLGVYAVCVLLIVLFWGGIAAVIGHGCHRDVLPTEAPTTVEVPYDAQQMATELERMSFQLGVVYGARSVSILKLRGTQHVELEALYRIADSLRAEDKNK